LDLFTAIIPESKQHRIFQMLLQPAYAPERAVLAQWAQDFLDRDGKFVHEFQSTFESSFWELYLNAAARAWGWEVDRSHASPDFVVTSPTSFCVEATIAAPPQGGKSPIAYDIADIPEDFGEFNAQASIRICNSFTAKVKRYREYYVSLPHTVDRPFVIAIAAFDRPLSHLSAGRSIMAALYGLYHDEAATSPDAEKVVSYNVAAAMKSETVDVPMALFCDDSYSDVSAVIYSSLVTWGKIRALANNPDARTIYQTVHPREGHLIPEIRRALKKDYVEHLFDGMYVLHNPFAKHPLPSGVLSHPRLAEVRVAEDGELRIDAPDDFLLVRMLWSIHEDSDAKGVS
jgi:hypothetical protein